MVRSSLYAVRHNIVRLATSEVLESRRLLSGSFDITFNQTGRQLIGFGNQQDEGAAVALTANGSIVAAGSTVGNDGKQRVALTRLNSDGSPDVNFGASGATQSLINGNSAKATAVATLANGSILVAGVVTTSGLVSDGFLARFNSSGVLDTTFGTNGVVTRNFGGADDMVAGIAVNTATGVISLVGSGGAAGAHHIEVVRYTAGGQLDFSLAGGAVTTIGTQSSSGSGSVSEGAGGIPNLGTIANLDATGIAVSSTGKIFIAAQAVITSGGAPDFAVAAVTSTGVLDNSFGTGGLFATDFAGVNGTDGARSVAVQSDGSIVVAGYTGDPTTSAGQSDYAVLRLTSTGLFDSTFGTGGKFQFGRRGLTGGLSEVANAVVLQADGKVLLVGASTDPSQLTPTPGVAKTSVAIVRLTSAGALDATFGTNGVRVSDQGGNTDDGRAGVLQADGRLLVVGVANAGQFGDIDITRVTTGDVPFVGVFSTTANQNGQLVLPVKLSDASTTAVTVPYSIIGSTAVVGTDFNGTGGTITFQPGETSKSISIQTVVNSQNVAGRSLTVTLGTPTGAILSSANGTGTILGISAGVIPSVSVLPTTVVETLSGKSVVTVTLQLSNAFTSDVTVDFATSNGTALAGSDYVSSSGTVTFTRADMIQGVLTQSVKLTILGDFLPESTEAFKIALSNPVNANIADVADITITDAKFQTVNFTSKKKATYIDSRKNSFTVTLSGSGTGQLILPIGANVDADTLVLDKTTSKSIVTFTPKKASAVATLNQVISKKAVGTLDLKPVNLNGNLSANGIGTLKLRNVSGGAISLGTSKSAVTDVTLGNLSESSLTTGGSIKQLTLGSWTDADTQADSITARSITAITAKSGEFGADIKTGSLGTLTAKGVIRGSVIRSDSSVTSVTAAGLINSSILVGTTTGTTGLPSKTTQFVKRSKLQSLGNLTLKAASKKSPAVFTDSVIAAPLIGVVTLGTVSTTGSSDFGVAAQKGIASVAAALPGKSKFSKKVVTSKDNYADSKVTNFKIRLTA